MAKEKEGLTEAQVEYQKLIDAYAKSNPVKFEEKKAELEDKLSRVLSVKKGGKGEAEFTFAPKKA